MAEDPGGRRQGEDRRSSVERLAERFGDAAPLATPPQAPAATPAPAPLPPAPAPLPPAPAPLPAAVHQPAPAAKAPPPPAAPAALEEAVAKPNGNGTRRTTKRAKLDMDRLRTLGMVTSYTDRSHIAEEFRLVKRPLLLKAFAAPPDNIDNGNLIMVTSAKAGEGKTFCAVSLAMSIALERDLTVLLVDADVAKPDIPNVLGIENQKGLVDLIADDDLDLSDLLIRTDLDNLTILPAGRQHHLATELLASEKMDRFVEEIARRYADRVIIFDSPPVLMSSVPSVLALHVGQILFVVEAERTVQQSIDTSLGLISTCKNVSLLLNKAPPGGNSDRFGAYYGYGYGANR
jgi:receptor protein-tyrosine kinase